MSVKEVVTSGSVNNGAAVLHDDVVQLVTFRLGSEDFGIDILHVHEIIRIQRITRVPNSPNYVIGVINIRGKVIPIVSMRERLYMPEVEQSEDSRIVVVEVKGKTVGFIVDQVNDVLSVSESLLTPPPQSATSVDNAYIDSVVKMEDRLVVLLNLDRSLFDGHNLMNEDED